MVLNVTASDFSPGGFSAWTPAPLPSDQHASLPWNRGDAKTPGHGGAAAQAAPAVNSWASRLKASTVVAPVVPQKTEPQDALVTEPPVEGASTIQETQIEQGAPSAQPAAPALVSAQDGVTTQSVAEDWSSLGTLGLKPRRISQVPFSYPVGFREVATSPATCHASFVALPPTTRPFRPKKFQHGGITHVPPPFHSSP